MTEEIYKPKVLVLGHGRHGKDTVAEILKHKYGLTFESSSFYAAEIVMMPYFAEAGAPYESVEECYADRHSSDVMRSVWYDQISAYNTPDKSRLASKILETSDMYVGMRSLEEYEATQDLFDYIVWVDASARGLPLEPETSMTIEFNPFTMWKIHNDGTLGDLHKRVWSFAEDVLGLTKIETEAETVDAV